eukprot:1743250-Pleurochrysis_carterae.AAC.1
MSGFGRRGQSRCQCLPPQCRHAPCMALHWEANAFGFSVRFGSHFFNGSLGFPGLPPGRCASKARPELASCVRCISRASSSPNVSRMAVSVGASCPVARERAIFTSSRVLALSPMRLTTCDNFSAITPSDRR